jgi:DNA mismatch repair protein MutS
MDSITTTGEQHDGDDPQLLGRAQ